MSNFMDRLVKVLYRATIEYNWVNKDYWKIICYHGKIVVASGYHLIEISNLPETFKPGGLYFDLQNMRWGNKLEFPIGNEDIEKQLGRPMEGCFDANTNLLLHYCDSFNDEIRRKSRLIIAPQVTKQGEYVLSFDIDENKRPYLAYNNMAFSVSDNGQIRPADIIPHVPYVCTVQEIRGNEYVMNVLSPGNKIKMGLVFTPGVFWPENQEQINELYEMRNIPQEFIFGAFHTVNNYLPNPINLDTGLFTDTVKVLSLSDALFVRFHCNKNDGKAIMLETIGKPEDIKIKAVIGTLEPVFGPQRR